MTELVTSSGLSSGETAVILKHKSILISGDFIHKQFVRWWLEANKGKAVEYSQTTSTSEVTTVDQELRKSLLKPLLPPSSQIKTLTSIIHHN